MYYRKYKFNTIKRVEMKDDPKKGKRCLLELVIKDITDGTHYLLAEYVFVPHGKNASFLCSPNALQWNRTADVYLILTAKNLGRWVHHFKQKRTLKRSYKKQEMITWTLLNMTLEAPILILNSLYKEAS